MRVLHIISSSGMYGAEGVILNLSRGLNGRGHTSMLGVFQHSDHQESPLLDAARAAGIESYPIRCKGQIDFSAVRALRSLVRHSHADILHAHGYKADIYSYFAVQGNDIPMISTCHNWLDTDMATRVYGVVDRFVLRRYSRVVAVSSAVRMRLIRSGIQQEKVSIIRNGVEVKVFDRREAPSGESCPLIVGFAGRLSVEKGADLFLETAAIIREKFPTVRFVLVGEGPERERLESLMDRLNLRECLSMPGRCDDMPKFYASLSVLVSTSRTEGLPMGLLEAMASRLPIVATDVGDVSSLVCDGETGFLVASGDVSQLGHAISKLLQDRALCDRFGAAGRARVAREFSAESMTNQYLAIYEEALSRKQPLPRSRVSN